MGTAGCVIASTGVLVVGLGINLLTFYSSAAMFGVGPGLASVALTALAALSVPLSEKPHALATFSAGFDAGVMTGSIMLAVMVLIGLSLTIAFTVAALVGVFSVLNYNVLRDMESTVRSMASTSLDMDKAAP